MWFLEGKCSIHLPWGNSHKTVSTSTVKKNELYPKMGPIYLRGGKLILCDERFVQKWSILVCKWKVKITKKRESQGYYAHLFFILPTKQHLKKAWNSLKNWLFMVRNLLEKLITMILMFITALVNYFSFRNSLFWSHFLACKNGFPFFMFTFSRWILVIKKPTFFSMAPIEHSKYVIYKIQTGKWKLQKLNILISQAHASIFHSADFVWCDIDPKSVNFEQYPFLGPRQLRGRKRPF